MIYFITKLISRTAMGLFFNRISPANQKNIPSHGPVIFASNHPNTMIDPMVIIHVCGKKLSFFAKNTLFNTPLNRWFLGKLQLIPMYRTQDNPQSLNKNTDSFSAGFNILKNNGSFLIFPEGISTGERILHKIKTGTARIGLEAEAKFDWNLGITIIPVGLCYSDAVKFRSDVIVRFGPPIRVRDYKHAYEANGFEAVQLLTGKIKTAINKLTDNLKNIELEEMVSGLEMIYKKELMVNLGLDINSKSDEFSVTKVLLSAVEWYFVNRPDKVAEFRTMLHKYLHHLDLLRLKDEYLDPSGKSASTWDRAKALGYIISGFPFYIYGLVNNVLPYKFPRWFAGRFARIKAEVAPTKLLAGAGIFIIIYTLEIFLIAYLSKSIFWTFLYIVCLIPSGNFVLTYVKKVRKYRQHLRFLSIFYRKRNLMYSLIKQRQDIINYLNHTREIYMKVADIKISDNN